MSSAPHVFVGPTLSPEEVRALLPDAVIHPPVGQGDVYRVLSSAPSVIGIIVGLFDRVPAVWHKEILFALSEGVMVLGAASMGALRAAELDAFGMIGIGTVYESYRDGLLEDDDEVAIAHASAEAGFRELSDAMVNIRATIRAAEGAAVIGPATAQLLEQAAKDMFYPERTFMAAIDGAAALGAHPGELGDFRVWLPKGRVHVKQDDARRLLECMRQLPATDRPAFKFSNTVFFAEVMAAAPWESSDGVDVASGHAGVLDELRLRPDAWHHTVHGATLRALAEGDAEARGLAVTDEALVDATTSFRRERALHDSADLVAWMDANDLDGDDFIALMENQARLGWLLRSSHHEALDYVPDELRARGQWTALTVRAEEKARWIESEGFALASLSDFGIREADVFRWYFTERLGQAPPQDIWAYARSTGFSDVEEFRRAVAHEYLFSVRGPGGRAGSHQR